MTLLLGKYRIELDFAPVRGTLFLFSRSEPGAYRFSVSAYVWPVVFHIEERKIGRVR